jgi:hypothetical protein
MPRKQSEIVHLKLRFPERVRVRIEAAAKKNARSMNAEIVHRLEQSFETDERVDLVKTTAAETADAIDERFFGALDAFEKAMSERFRSLEGSKRKPK